ncbi:HECTD4 isoform 3 [Pan troglodytes]|uniref:HECTD4 isoform 3 n=1 Tax=Pan troglodytes TaxID=9598 RepID=A0A2J8MYK3_PANTR|nr:HECTD4 isoform 3 [Pan troglodytes]
MGSSAAAAAAAAAAADSAQWLSVKEETIFLHDGLIRVTDLAELPSEILGAPEAADTDLEILTFETKNPSELAERLRSVCGNQSNAYARLLEYRLNALRGLWNAQRQLALEEQHERESSGDEETLALLKRQGLLQQPEQAPFTSRMGLLLVFPLIQSQSRTDPSLCNITAEVLLNCLRDCQPLSLTKEPADCLNGIETLLCSWLEETSDTGRHIPHKQKENAAAALVALACARGSLKTFVHTVHLLQKQTDLGSLPVADVLYRGFVYCRNEELEPGWVAFGSGSLLHRPVSFDNKPHSLFQVIDQNTLQVCQVVPMPANHLPIGSTMSTVHLSSDGTYFYWIWSPASLNEKTPKGHSVFMDIFELVVENGVFVANPLQERTILMRKEGESAKSINEMLLSRLSRYRASPSATLAALTGSTISNTLKEDQAVLASSLVYNISDGQFTSRADLIDAAGSSLGRGALVPGLGACYDTVNNMLWTCSNDYIDQWCNPGNQAFHYVCQRLGVSHIITEPKEEAITTNEVINQLLHHVGAMCIHQLNLLATNPNLPITSVLGKQHPIEAHHLSSICDIMEKAMVNGDTCIIRCILVVFQVVFKFFFSPQTERNRDIIRRSGLLLWQLLMAPKDQICPEIQKEVCLAISSGLNILYPGETEINNLLKLVLTEGERNSGLSQLRDVILTNLAEQLQNNRFGSDEDDHYRLNDELLHYILKIVVRESCILITKCQTVSKDDFQKLLSTVPAASSCLRYLMAVQNHLLSNTILIKPDENDDSDSSLQGETLKVQELKVSILALATQILTGCDEVLEMLQQVTTALINSDIADREQRLKGLEQVTKATMLGHLLPVLLTSLMHPNLQTLIMADALMPQLVQLVLYTSQTALLLKTQCPVFAEVGCSPCGAPDQKCRLFPDERMLEEKEEPGFLTGLKIPAPWAAGKTVETVHPVRDNYKFKETVHIPGARCLYLRFDSRCSSQYDYDKLVIYAGPNTNSRKVAEYGGNTLGYGSRSVLGTGWPKDLVKVEGDTVTFSFEMRSGREHNTPDKAMWGFACTVRAQESSEDVSGGLPFLVDLALGLSVLACSMLRILYNGPEITKEEEACQELLRSKLLQREKFLQEVNSLIQKPSHPLAKTKTLVKSLMNRAELLLHVTIAAQSGLTRSISGTPAETPACKSASETKVISHAVRQPVFLRSMSAPSDLEMIGNEDLEFTRANQRRRHVTSHRSSSFTLLQSLAIEDSRDKPTYSVLLGQLFAFIGTNPDQAVSSSSFLLAAQTRWRRGNTRKQALVHMRELLTAAVRVGGVTHLVGPVTMVLQGGPRIEELTCGGMVEQVQEAFGETMTSVVSLCARYPIACANSIGLLCTIPYTRSEEKCLVRSGLVQLMDRLCSLSNQTESSSSEKQTKKQKVATMAWAAFQVLANRCVEWEKEEGGSTEAVHSGLARQVSSLLTNHLARATECCGNQAAGNDALQDVLSLLNDLSRSHIGKAILSQPACVSKLLSLLLDQRPSPKLVLIILQLCRAALPLMSVEDCGNVELPPWSYSVPSLNSEQEDPSDPASKIASLLLAKLADYVVPGCQTVLSPTASEPDTTLTKTSPKNSLKGDKDPGEESEAVDGKLSIFIHKREDQSSHEVLQPLLSSSEGRPFRLGTGANMEKVVKMDRDMTKGGCCEVITEEAAAALRKATKWAQSGLIVSIGPPVESINPETVSGLSTGDKKKTAQTSICRERNSELARTDPVRPFISGHVANSMAAEVIALLHSLLMAPESNAAQIWTTTAEKVLSRALMYIPQLGKYAESILENGSSSGRKLAKLQRIARQAVAALCALGGFKETIKIGSEVQVLGRGISGSIGVVASINEQEGIATVRFPPIDCRKTSQASDTLTIPLSRLCVPRSEALPLHKLSITEKVVQAVQSMLLPQEGSLSIHTSLPATGDGSAPVMAVVRLLAEIRTRACLVMAQLLEDSLFCEEFIQQCPAAVEVLNLVAQECSAGERLAVVEVQCERLRMLYRDCARPPPPPLQADRRQPKEITWSPSRVFPPVRACMFSSHLTSVTFLADPSAGGGLPRGTFIYATSPLPVQAPSFYWEIEIVSYGDTDDDTGPIVSFGFTTEAEKRDGAWTNPVGTCLFHNNGRAVHYNGSSLLQWKSVRLDVTLSPGDVAGIGWERTEGTPPPPGQPAKGRVYFTYCGQRLLPYLEDVSGGMWPVNTKTRANFGSRPFAYAEGQAHRNAADLCTDLAEEISANFEALPFAMASDSDNDAGTSIASDPGTHGPPCRIAAVATAQQQYDSDTSCHYKVELSYENFITSGPDPHPPPIADDESDDDDDDDIPQEDHYALLVKAWETKVFPTIRRRFRNEAERKSGLDQIKGALQLGMVDIARQTVEFLYEENGGIPRDLYLPTIEDIKDEANKFTIDKVRKGLTVVTRSPDSNNVASSAVGTALPKFAIRGMLKTFGLHGVVLDVDSVNELVQVETYLRSEGVLVRYWYPIDMLERPPAGYRRTATNGLVTLDNTNLQIHRELLRCEAALARLYCRMALLNIFAPKLPHLFTRLFHIPAIRDITLEHLQLLSNQLLAPPLPDGTISSSSILLAQSLQHCIHSQNCSATDLFYQGNSQTVREWLNVAITRTLHQGEESLLELTKQICSFLQTAPEQFPSEEFPISESKVNMDVNFPGAAFVVVSCKESQSGFRKDSSLYKAPWARVLVYGLGHKVKRNGQLNLIEAACYPRDASPANTGLAPPPTADQYPSVVLSTDRVHIKLGVSPPPGAVLVLHSLPLEFPLAMAFAEQLLSWKSEDSEGKSEDEPDTIPTSVLLQVVELLGNFLWTTDMAACVKELVFHLLAELLRTVHTLEQRRHPAGLSSSIALQLNPCLAMLMALQSELHKLYDEETQNWVSGGACGGSGGAAAGDQGRFSTYFHALMEGCLAVAEVTLPTNMSVTASGVTSATAPNLSDSSSSSSSSPGQTPQSPSLLSKRKKVKMKREKASSSGKRQSSRTVDSDPTVLSIGGSKPEDMLWFHRALTLLIILRHLTRKDPQGLGVTSDAIADACQALVGPTAHSRLLVISGIPTHLDEGVVRGAIRKACNAHGGVFKDEIYIPLQEEDTKKPKDKAEGGDGKVEPEKTLAFPGTDSMEVSTSSSLTPAMSISASASTSQASICSSQGISQTVSDLSVDPLPAGLELPIPPGLLEPHAVSSQESLDISLCSTGSLGSLGSLGEPLDNAETASVSDMGSMYTVTSLDNQPLAARPIKGFAVVEIRSRAKIEKIRASLFNNNDLIGLSSLDGEDELMEMSTEEILTVSVVNQSLFDTQGSPGLEDYFNDKSIKGEKLVPGAREVLTEIFKSCAHSEQTLSLTPAKPIRVSDIYLSKEQINSQTPGNLLHLFFTNVRPPKKVLEDQLTQILRKYGVPKPKFDKSKYSKAGKEQHPVKVVSTKRPITKPPAKDKAVLNSVRTALSEKKPTVKPKSPEKSKPDEKDPEKSPTKKQEVPEEKYLTLEGFHKFVIDRAKQDIRSVWRAILSCGYDLHFERCACIDVRHAQKASRKWTLEMDVALVQYINQLCRHLAITPARLHPHEVYLDPADAADPRVACLLNVPIESLRLRFALLQSLNTTLETFFLPLVELRQTPMYTHSIAALLKEAKGLIFYDTKVTVMNRVLNATVQRTADHAAPEITLDPLEIVGGEIRASENSYFCQAARQLASVPSSQLCVKLASGGDPTYAFNIRFTGEEVHGTSGSFRHFLWQVCKELQSSSLSLLLLCPSSAVNKNKGKYILTPSPITYGEEQLLHFLGQLLGIAIRADVPLPLDLLPSFWKTLVGEPLDPEQDLQEADILTYNYVKKFESINDETELEALCAEIASQHLATESPDSPNKPCCRFTYLTMTGEEVELCSRGRHILVAWENKDIYAAAIRSLRLRELQNVECVTAVRAGLGSIIPLQLLTTLSPLEMELRTCGLPYINLEFLKAHTMYQVGLMETDQHIEFFWGALEMFTQEELCKFIKFACNQERIPFTCPCKDGGPDTAHVPPYPMKIAPPDGTAGSPDSRYIRVETCMFMIKLPQYSSLEIMLEKLRCAIHYREDPLSG